MSEPDGITIAEATRRLNVSERTLRRVLARPEYTGRTVTQHRQTKTGTRDTCLLPADVLSDLAAHFASWETPADTGTENTAQTVANAGNTGTDSRENTGTTQATADVRLVVATYERLITEQQARIADLTTALEHERITGRTLADALAREQALRALPVYQPQAAPPVENAVQDAQETRTDTVETNTVNPPLAAGMGAQGPQEPRRAWWRFWRR
jgi:hypothetical protein